MTDSPLLSYLLAADVLALLLMFSDKRRAKRGDRRIPEAALFLAALLGGMIASDLALGITSSYFMQEMPKAVPIANLWLACAKAAAFGVAIALIGCHYGLRVKPNTESLGQGTTSSVVTAITTVILIDALFAVLFKSVGLDI